MIADEFNMNDMQRDRRDSCLHLFAFLGVHEAVLSPERDPDEDEQNDHDR